MGQNISLTVGEALPGFVAYMRVEKCFAPTTVKKYQENVSWFVRDIGDLPIADIRLDHFIALKGCMLRRGAREARIAGVIFAMKGLLAYAQHVLGIQILELKNVRAPREPRREVVYLTGDEVGLFLSAIRIDTPWTQQPHIAGYCFRALVETLLATGMRISEALSLNRNSIDFEKREAVVIGKGNRQRTVFFTPRSLEWIRRYLDLRKDSGQPLFVSLTGTRLAVKSTESTFRRVCRKAGLDKHVTPHTLRHTAATNLLHKGCPIGFIKEVLGHQRLETTCHYYLGVLSKADTKRAFDAYMVYGDTQDASSAGLSQPLPLH